MKLDGIREKVFLDRYSLKDKSGKPIEKTPDEMWKRVAKGIAGVEKPRDRKKWEKKFFDLMQDFKFLPGGRILAGAGTGFDVTYYNCFVIPNPPDSRGGIMANLTQMIEIMAHGGGVGLNLSSLRPRGSRVKKVNGFSSGPINWAELYSLATKDIVQQGGSRRGALMLMLWDWHPDIEEFITVKQDLNKINGANLSVCLSDAFMEAVKKNDDWDLVYPDLDDPRYDKKWNGDLDAWKKIGGKVKVVKTVKAKYLWNLICTAAWQSAEPGLHFLDRSNKRSNTHYFETLIATNPCGEQPLSAWAVCNLGALNLAAYVKNKQFDYDAFSKDVQVAVRFLDNVIDDTYYFYKENEKVAKDIRRQGLGILGLADALIK
ncbi:MAG: ribonucleotide reductase N-terminal alpha domain-containing protein, partial [Candidatus Levyibacteriota bacterium]